MTRFLHWADEFVGALGLIALMVFCMVATTLTRPHREASK